MVGTWGVLTAECGECDEDIGPLPPAEDVRRHLCSVGLQSRHDTRGIRWGAWGCSLDVQGRAEQPQKSLCTPCIAQAQHMHSTYKPCTAHAQYTCTCMCVHACAYRAGQEEHLEERGAVVEAERAEEVLVQRLAVQLGDVVGGSGHLLGIRRKGLGSGLWGQGSGIWGVGSGSEGRVGDRIRDEGWG